MAALTLTRERYRDAVYGGWLGKNIGSTLGAPVEGRLQIHQLRFYDPLPGQPTANDDLDFQLVWLHALREHGVDLTPDELGSEWLDHIAYVWDEYGYAARNLRRGLRPPITGAFDNWFRHSLGGAMRTEIWAMIAPGAPQVAAAYAYRDASIDHAEEGVWAAMFWAAVQSAAFFLNDSAALLDVGLAMIPGNCRTARAVQIVREARRDDASPLEVRSRILTAVGHPSFTDAAQNVGFAVLGWLYGADFGSSLCTAVNCGYDADGNGATLGALLGILRGRTGLPEEWTRPIGDAVVVGWGVVELEVERTVAELTDHTVAVGEQVIEAMCPDVALVDGPLGTTADLALPAAPLETAPQPPPFSASLPAEGDASSAIGSGRFLELDPPPAAPDSASAGAAPTRPPVLPTTPEAPVSPTAPSTPEISVAPAPDSAAAPAIDPALEALSKLLPDTPATAGSVPPVATAPPAVGSDAPSAPGAAASVAGGAPSAPALAGEPAPIAAPAVPAPSPVAPPPAAVAIDWKANERIKPLLVTSATTAVYHAAGFEITVDYGAGGPAIVPNVATSLTVAIRNLGEEDFLGHVGLAAPAGWQVAVPGAQGQRQMLARGGMARYGFVLRVPDTVPLLPRNVVTLLLTPERAPAIPCEIALLGGSCWWMVGPLSNVGEVGYDKGYEVEDKPGLENDYLGRGGGLVRWQKLAFKETVLPLEQLLFTGLPGVAYALTTLHVPVPTDARLVFHSTDGLKVWLNNRRILQWHSHDPFRPTLAGGPSSVDVTLPPGDSRLMVKIVRCGAPLEFSFAVTDRNGRPLEEVGNTRW